jgi:DNA helicase-2/ATP-dependent DNA helicase PcrA
MYDFDDALCSSLKLDSKKFTWIQVDECQDLSPMQWLIIKHHSDEQANIVLFGDINQSIYRFLGANIEVTSKELGKDILELPVNYRSPENLVEFFNLYLSINFPERQLSKALSVKSSNPNALIHVHRREEQDQTDVLIKHAINLVKNKKNTAFLCPTNSAVGKVSVLLNEAGVDHFRISQNDILTSRLALDFIAFLKAMHSDSDHHSWARLLWMFGNVPGLSDNDNKTILAPKLHALSIAAQLANEGASLRDIIEGESIYDHMMTKFVRAFEQGYSYFDTETTGLSSEDRIIQIAGVNIYGGSVSDEVDLFCISDKTVGESKKIHNITDDFLKMNGCSFEAQVSKFFSFSSGKVLIAHNLKFDEKMILSNLERYSPHLVSYFKSTEKLCSLVLSRRLFPNLKSHKLGSLLNIFGLEGENSHNALDDVKAGANFLNFTIDHVKLASNNIDEIISLYETTFKNFSTNFSDLLTKFKCIEDQVELDDLFDLYFDFVLQKGLYKGELDKPKFIELKYKLCRWAKQMFPPMSTTNFIDAIVPHLTTLKESDLILDEDNLVVSTIHRAKGLEFDYVILPSVITDNFPAFPIQKMIEGEEKENLVNEQRRLLYVAISRAKKQLVLGTCDEGRYRRTAPCEFISPLLHTMEKY